jgi:hypothetical protein
MCHFYMFELHSSKSEYRPYTLLSDSHAEALVRRSFIRYIMKTIIACLRNPSYTENILCPLQIPTTKSGRNMFEIKPSWSFRLYISENPCGDASIFKRNSNHFNFTGAKIISIDKTTTTTNNNTNWIREDVQALGPLRTKSGRSDIIESHRSTSHCCSDKICRWQVLGLQG